MKRYVPVEKRSKKEQKELARLRRGSWGGVNPVTRKPPNPKAYSRKKARREGVFFDEGSFSFVGKGDGEGLVPRWSGAMGDSHQACARWG